MGHMSGCSLSGDEGSSKGVRPINKVLDNSSESLYHEKANVVVTTSAPPTSKQHIKQPHHSQVNRVVDDSSVQSLFQRIGNTHHVGVPATAQSPGVIDKTDYTSSITNDST